MSFASNTQYELTFDLAGLDYINFVMSGLWATDNTAAMKLNSNDTGIRTTLGAPFQSLQSFTIGNGFMPGINKLEFVVTNISLGASGNNPTGLLVADLQGTIVPIPGAVWLFCSGLICLVGLKRRLRFGERSL